MTENEQLAMCHIDPPFNVKSTKDSNQDLQKAAVKEVGKDGSFKRQQNRFTTPFGNKPGQLPVEAGRYRLLWSPACPWAHRSVMARRLLGLEDVISLGTVSPIRPNIPRIDWEFSLDEDNQDPVLGIRYMSEIYEKSAPNFEGRPTVPVVVDIKENRAVNNDYFNLSNYLETTWTPFHKEGAPELYPEPLRADIDALSKVIFHDVNNGVYQCGFAQSQEAYETAYDRLFARLDELEERLSHQRFLFGDFITDSDIRLYSTLARFDIAYYFVFKANRQRIADYPNLWGYARDLYQTPGFGDTTDFDAIKRHYHLSIKLFPEDRLDQKILPKGPDLSGWTTSHGREALSKSKTKFLIK